jgi:hypothetical protein
MKKSLKIGQKEYKYKKDAIIHYRTILNSYDYEKSLNESDFNDIIDLLNYDFFNYLVENETSEEKNEIDNSSEKEIGCKSTI